MPLISLIEDNLNFVLSLGIPACSLSAAQNSGQSIGQLYNGIQNLKYKIVYVTPEKLAASPPLLNVVEDLFKRKLIDRFVIDEVHCVSAWGQDFRPDYLKLSVLHSHYPGVPILGLTATATQRVRDDVVARLGIEDDVTIFQSSFNRKNLSYEIRDKKQLTDVDLDLSKLLKTRFQGKSGIIYCTSRKECERLTEVLQRNHKIKCAFYHGQLSYTQR